MVERASGAEARGGGAPDHIPLRRRDLALIVGFWTLMAVLTAANGLLDPRGRGLTPLIPSAPVAMAFLESYLWALLTPFIFWLASRASVERSNWVPRALLLLGVGIVVAMGVEAVVGYLRFEVFYAPRRPPPGAGPGPGPRGFNPLWGASRLFWLDDLIVYMAVLAAGVARDYFLRYRARREESIRLAAEAARLQAQLAEARLDVLRRQLDPHFLFNTLNAVSALVERDPRGVRRMIARLSDLLRHSIDGADTPEVPLKQELDLLQRYVDIMQVRFQGRLDVRTYVDEEATNALVPTMILQPLVENAIKHGVERLTGPGQIELAAELAGNDVVLRVRDNGPGPANGAGAARGSGVGLRNTVARLEQLYGDEQSFTLHEAEGGGTVAEIRLPYHTRAAAPADSLPAPR